MINILDGIMDYLVPGIHFGRMIIGADVRMLECLKAWLTDGYTFLFCIFFFHFHFPAQLVGDFTLSDLLDKPRSQVPSLLVI